MMGATKEEWDAFSSPDMDILADLRPVVSDNAVPLAPGSSLKETGKTPSFVRTLADGHDVAVGMPGWTQLQTDKDHIKSWRRDPRHGIAVQCRNVVGIDIDVEDHGIAKMLRDFITTHLGIPLPERGRPDSGKCLLAVKVEGDGSHRAKHVVHVDGGMVEILGSGNHFVACGTHPKGRRYTWKNQTPTGFPTITQAQLDSLREALQAEFGEEAPMRPRATAPRSRAVVADSALAEDVIYQELLKLELVRKVHQNGAVDIFCPWRDEHTSEGPESETRYYPPNTNFRPDAGFKCLHAHCEGRTAEHLKEFLGLRGGAADFEDLDEQTVPEAVKGKEVEDPQFTWLKGFDGCSQTALQYAIDGVLPDVEVILCYGPSGSGKTLLLIDMLMAIARGVPWRGLKTERSRVAYVVGEGAKGVEGRLNAYYKAKGIRASDDIEFFRLPHTPNLFLDPTQRLRKDSDVVHDRTRLVRSLRRLGGVRVLVLDTVAALTAGMNENDPSAVTEFLAWCHRVAKALHLVIILVHHSGKDSTKGARGHSSFVGNVDCIWELTRSKGKRHFRLFKMKDSAEHEDGDPGWEYRTQPVEIGFLRSGKAATSAVIEHVNVEFDQGLADPMSKTLECMLLALAMDGKC